eukprot:10259338-Ditylum_brightwellii.AAC.1
MVNRKQFTMVWHVDNLKISHVDPKVVDDFIEWQGTKWQAINHERESAQLPRNETRFLLTKENESVNEGIH